MMTKNIIIDYAFPSTTYRERTRDFGTAPYLAAILEPIKNRVTVLDQFHGLSVKVPVPYRNFLDLAAEVRVMIYKMACKNSQIKIVYTKHSKLEGFEPTQLPSVDAMESSHALLRVCRTVRAEASPILFNNLNISHWGIFNKSFSDFASSIHPSYLKRIQELTVFDPVLNADIIDKLPALKTFDVGDRATPGCTMDISLNHVSTEMHCHEIDYKVEYGRGVGEQGLGLLRASAKRTIPIMVYAEALIECNHTGQALLVNVKYDLDSNKVLAAYDHDGDTLKLDMEPGTMELNEFAGFLCNHIESGE